MDKSGHKALYAQNLKIELRREVLQLYLKVLTLQKTNRDNFC